MAAPGGIVRTASGRQTYAPDGLTESMTPGLSDRSHSDATTSDTSGTLTGDTPLQTHDGVGYITEEGKEAVEEPVAEQPPINNRNRAFEPIHAGDTQTLTRIASQLSRSQSHYSGRSSGVSGEGNDLDRTNTLTGLEFGDEVIDPNSPKFDLYKWIRMLMSKIDEDGIKTARAGVVFKDLTIRGSGSALNLQQNVGSILMAPLRIKEHISFGSKPSKTILHSFDGVMKSGEMLIVLGRPGSGCSTLLKTSNCKS